MTTTENPQNRPSKNPENEILTYFLAELDCEIISDEEGNIRITKGQALIKSMVNAALKGDQRMLGSVLKLIDKLQDKKNDPAAVPEEPVSPSTDWHNLFAFYGKYKKLIEAEIRKLKKEDPDYWSFEWFRPALKTAPWYPDLYGK